MPLDPRIALGTQAPQLRSPIGTLGALQQVREHEEINRQRQLMNEQRERDLDDDDAIRSSLQRVGRPDDAVEELYAGGRAEAAGKLAKSLYEQRKAKADEADKLITTQKKQVEFGAQIFQSASDQASWDTAYTAAKSVLPPDLMQHVPKLYDPAVQKQLVEFGMSVAEKLKAQQDAIKNANDAWQLQNTQYENMTKRQEAMMKAREHWTKASSSLLSTAHNQQEWDGYQAMLAKQGAPIDVLAMFGNQHSPETIARAKALGQTPHEVETVRQGDVSNNLRREELQRRKDEDAATPGGPGGGKPLTANRVSEIDEWAARQYAGVEKDIRENPALFGEDGKFTEAGQAELGNRKLAIEDQSRKMKGMPPLLETEYAAAEAGKESDLRKIRHVYKRLTGMETPLQRIDALVTKIKGEKDPKVVKDLRKQLADLHAEYKSTVGR